MMFLTKLAALAALFPLTHAHAIRPRGTQGREGPGYISFPVTGRESLDPIGRHTRRQAKVDAADKMAGTIYTIDITLGTPGQTIPVQFDTGASELWVNAVCSNASNPEFCGEQPRFTKSSTLEEQDGVVHKAYGAGWANCQYVEDFVDVGSARVSKQRFGMAFESQKLNVGVLGAAPSFDGWTNEYPSLFDNLADQGLVDSRSFGMDLRGFHTNDGAVIFGGLDTKKFTGPLQKLPVVDPADAPEKIIRWWVHLDGISVTNGDGDTTSVFEAPSGKGEVATVDSGYTTTSLPPDIFKKLLAAFPGAKKRKDGLYKVDCLPEGEGGFVSFTFQDVTIDVPYFDFMWNVPSAKNYCILGAFESDKAVLGDTFLRGAYVVYDFDQKTVHVAQSADCGSNIVAIRADGVSVTKGDCGKK